MSEDDKQRLAATVETLDTCVPSTASAVLHLMVQTHGGFFGKVALDSLAPPKTGFRVTLFGIDAADEDQLGATRLWHRRASERCKRRRIFAKKTPQDHPLERIEFLAQASADELAEVNAQLGALQDSMNMLMAAMGDLIDAD